MSPFESWALICNLAAIVSLSGALAMQSTEKSNDDA